MKRLSTIEKSTVVLGLMFIVVGACMIVHPFEGFFFHPNPDRYETMLGPNPPEHVTKRGSQLYGGISVVFGVGITCFAFYRGGK